MKIIITGDFYPVRRAEGKMRSNEYEYILGEIKPLVEKADYAIVNYESTFYGEGQEVAKFGPSMATDEQSVELAKWCGFDCFTLANNHIHDYGDRGLHDLFQCIKKFDIDFVGAGMNLSEAEQTLYKEICGETIAFVNCCEHEFNIANEEHGGANPLNAVRQYYAITEAKKQAQKVVVIVHGGSINCQLPSPRMQELYRFFVDCGANAVVNHHQHCFSGYEYYHNAPIVYGIGNLFFDKPWLKNTTWTDGFMCALNLIEGEFSVEVYPYSQCADEPRVVIKTGKDKETFFAKIDELNKIICDEKLLREEYLKWVDKNEEHCINALAFSNNRWILALQRRHLLPFIKTDTLYLMNYIYCEAHLDRMIRFFKKKYDVQ